MKKAIPKEWVDRVKTENFLPKKFSQYFTELCRRRLYSVIYDWYFCKDLDGKINEVEYKMI